MLPGKDEATLKLKVKSLLFDAAGRLRNGGWILVFLGFVAFTRFAYKPLSQGLRSLGLDGLGLEPLPFLLTLLATWGCTRLRGEPLASVGFLLDRRWARELGAGTLVGGTALLAVAFAIWAVGGVGFELDPSRSVSSMGIGLYVFLFVALLEENLFRGFLFQRLLGGVGPWAAQIALASLFALGHWGSPGMAGPTRVVAAVDLFLGAVLFGLAYLRTRSLALPVGLHLGWNWTQGPVLGFGVSGYEHAGWWRPSFPGEAVWLTGGAFGPEASLFSPLVSLLLIVLLWRWRGSVVARRRPGTEALLLGR